MHKRYLAMLLVIVMVMSLCPAIPVFAADSVNGTQPVEDMTVASIVYGWTSDGAFRSDAEGNAQEDGSYVTVKLMPAGENETETYTSAIEYGVSNAMTGAEEADVVVERCTAGSMVEVCLNAENEVINIRRVLQAGLNFDTAEYGGDLTAIGSKVEHRGAEYEDMYAKEGASATGATGVYLGLSGSMVATGWVLDKEDGSITIGDGNMATEVFNETYTVADDVKVYEVDSSGYIENGTATFASTEKTYNDIQVTPKSEDKNGDMTIYNTESDKRYMAVVIFDSDYTAYDEGTAKVAEIYYYSDPLEDVTDFVGKIAQSVRITSDLSDPNQGSPKPGNAPYLLSVNPITVVEGKMWTIGDHEDNCPVFRGGSDESMGKEGDGDWLVQFDTGWPRCGYQYMQNIDTVGLDPRDLDMLLVPHGHGDHYGALYDEWEMIVRSGAPGPIVYESYEDTIGYDIYGFPEIDGIYDDAPVRSIITEWYPMDEWVNLGDGLQMQMTLTPGHSQGAGSAVFEVTVAETMEDAKLNYEYDPTNEAADKYGYVTTYSNYEPGDQIFFCYMGGYGINGLNSVSKGYLRNAFVGSLRYIESVLTNLETTNGDEPDGIYNLAQHTNQYPYTETAYIMEKYNTDNETDWPFLHFMREGREEVINFCEKRASAMLYSEYTKDYMEAYESTDAQYSIDGTASKKADSSPYYEYDGVRIKTDITSARIKDNTIEDVGPFKHEGGETVIQISENVEPLVMHGYDVYLNKGSVPAGTYYNIAGENGIANENFDVTMGYAFAKDGFVYDPDAWYVQIGAHVMDGYDGNVYSNTDVNEGIEFTSGPVESFHGEGWVEIIRTEAMTKEEAEELAASLEKGAYYVVDLKKTGDINGTTFTPATDADIEEAYEAGYAKTLPTVDYIIENYPKLDDYYGQYIEGYYAYNDFAVGDDLRDAHFYVPADSVFNQPTVFIGVPSDEEIPYNFLVKSGWKDLADDKGLYLIMMEDGGDGWGEDDIAYIDQLCSDVGKRPFFCTFESNFYAVAYGDAADILQQHSVDNPKRWAAIAVVGAVDGMTEEKVAELQTTDSKVPGVPKSEVQTPIWIVADETAVDANIARMVEFYKSADHSSDTTIDSAIESVTIYAPEEGGTVDDEWCANVAVDSDDYDEASMLTKEYASAIYTELFEGMYRYPGDANGALRRPGEIKDRGFEYYTAEVPGGYYEDGSDVYTREWYVYAPESAQTKIDAGEEVPLVFVFHGAGGTGNEIADRSGWAKVADENGFIIVMPTGSIKITPREINNKVFPDMRPAWNTGAATETRPSDLELVRYIFDWMTSEYKYADSIDTTRVYASGQSSGGAMSWACAANLSDIFAAAAPVSAGGNREIPEDAGYTPVINFIGLQDGSFTNGYNDESGKTVIDKWTEFFNTVEGYDDYTYNGTGDKYSFKEGLFTGYVFEDEDGVPLLCGVEVTNKTHAIWPSECFTAWDDWFTHFSKDADGVLYYDGEAVENSAPDTEDGGSAGGETSKPSIRPGKDDDDNDRPTNPSTGSDAIFEDIDGHWAESAIEYVYDEGLMNGISADEFSPDTATTRGMIVTMLYRLEGEPAVTAECPFDDVDAGDYYHDAVVWASENGIVNGISDTEYAPNANITREQLAAMMNRYAEFKGYDVSASTSLGGFADADDVSDYAVEALEWAVAEELVNGMGDNTVAPQGTATRAQVATIFQRFIENIA